LIAAKEGGGVLDGRAKEGSIDSSEGGRRIEGRAMEGGIHSSFYAGLWPSQIRR